MTARLLLSIGIAVLTTGAAASAQCFGTIQTVKVTCTCSGQQIDQQVCRGGGAACDPTTGPVGMCGSTCGVINAGDCLASSGVWRELLGLTRRPLLAANQTTSSCGTYGKLSFEEWLRISLNNKRSRL